MPDLQLAIDSIGAVTFGAALAERVREGRVFLTGDAAHRMAPRGATGMNTAILSGHDIGWKLAWVPCRWAADELLDTYEAERRPVAEHNAARSADANGSLRDVGEALQVDLAGRIPHVWPDGSSTLDLLGPGLTRFTGPEGASVNGALPPVTVRALPALKARALGIRPGGSLLVRPDGVPA